MNKTIFDTSIVIIANQHNPTILHDSLLRSYEIIPGTFQVVQNQQVCTPAFSSVKYTNGIEFLVDNIRLQIKNTKPSPSKTDLSVDTLASAYLKRVPLVAYTHIGLNISYILKSEDPDFMKSHFIKKDFLRKFEIDDINLSFMKKLEDSILTVTTKMETGVEDNEFLIKVLGNYNFELKENESNEDIIKIIENYTAKIDDFEKVVETIFNSDEGK